MEKKRVVFKCKTRNLNIVLDRGGTIVTAVPGGTKAQTLPAKMAKFRNFGYVTSNPEEIEEIRQWALEHPVDGIKEVIPSTPEDILRQEEAKLAEQMKKVADLKESVSGEVGEEPEIEATVEEKTEEPKPSEDLELKCWICKATRSQNNLGKPFDMRGLLMHLTRQHRKSYKFNTIRRKLREIKNESAIPVGTEESTPNR